MSPFEGPIFGLPHLLAVPQCQGKRVQEEYGFTKQAVIHAATRVMSGRPQEMSTRALGSLAALTAKLCFLQRKLPSFGGFGGER